MNKKELICAVSAKTGKTQKDCELILNAAFATIEDTLATNETVRIIGFGSFGVRECAARTARNPRTNEIIQIPPSRVPTFKAGKGLKGKL